MIIKCDDLKSALYQFLNEVTNTLPYKNSARKVAFLQKLFSIAEYTDRNQSVYFILM